jgi:hypothetical protein
MSTEPKAHGRAVPSQPSHFLPAGPGDLFVVPEAGDAPVEWALLERRPENSDWFMAVPADTVSLAGSGDVEVPPGEPLAPLTLRCAHAVPLRERLLRRGWRTGALDPRTLAKALEALRAIEAKTYVASPLAEEVDRDPEYLDWIKDVVAPARLNLIVIATPKWNPRKSQGAPRRTLALAASVLIALGLGMTGGLLWQREQVMISEAERFRTERALAEERERRAQELQAERERHLRALAERLRRIGEERKRDRERIAALERQLEGTGRIEALVNVPFAYLAPRDPTRGEDKGLTVPPDADYLFLVLNTLDVPSFESLRLEILRRDNGERIWSRDGLTKNKINEVYLALPRQLLTPGEYRLRLYGLSDREAKLLREYDLTIER